MGNQEYNAKAEAIMTPEEKALSQERFNELMNNTFAGEIVYRDESVHVFKSIKELTDYLATKNDPANRP